MSQFKVYVTRRIPETGLEKLKQSNCLVTIWDSDDVITKQDLLQHVKGVDGILCLLTDEIDDEVIQTAGENLKVISTMSVGYEHIDLEACKSKGIAVTNTPNVSTDSVAELTVALLLMTTRRLPEGIEAVKKGQWGKWKPMWLCGIELSEKTVGILGLGRIGFGVAKRIQAFGIKRLIYHDVRQVEYAIEVNAEYVDFSTLLHDSDIICVCCNLTPETKEKFNKTAFQEMKKTAILINTGRGGVIQHDALYEALTSGEIAAAGLDVTNPEPLPHDNPLVSLNNCIILPHMGSNTWESRNHMSQCAAESLLAVLRGEQADGEVLPAEK